MAYLARIAPIEIDSVAPPVIETKRSPDFSDLEWSVIRLARIDALWTIRPAGFTRRLWNGFVGRPNPELANEQLEALRKMSVLSWHYGFTVAGESVADFLAAGFSIAQYELLITSIAKAINSSQPEQSPGAFD